MLMPIKKPSRLKKLAAGATLAAGLTLGAMGAGPAKTKIHVKEPTRKVWVMPAEEKRASDFVERRSETEQREMFRRGLAEGKKAGPDAEELRIEKEHLRIMEKFQKGELSKKEIDKMVKELKKAGIPLATGPELKKMGLIEDVTKLPKYVWGLLVRGARNVNEHYVLVGLAELITLFTYTQISRNARRRGLFRGIFETDRDRARLGELKELRNIEKFGVLPILALYTANHYVLGIILGTIANPYVRAQIVSLVRFFRDRGGPGSPQITGTSMPTRTERAPIEENPITRKMEDMDLRLRRVLNRLSGFWGVLEEQELERLRRLNSQGKLSPAEQMELRQLEWRKKEAERKKRKK